MTRVTWPTQRGGVKLGEGGYGAVRTLDDLPGGVPYVLDYVDLARGDVRSTVLTRQQLLSKLGHKVVYKEIYPSSSNTAPGGDFAAIKEHGSLLPRHDTRYFSSTERPKLLDIMRPWLPRRVGREEAAKWRFLTEVMRKGVKAPPVSTLMPLHGQNDEVYLCIREQARPEVMYPLYRYMHGDLVTLGEFYPLRVADVMGVARVILDCCSMLQLFGGIHHCDIKPENILFRVRGVRARGLPPAYDSLEERELHRTLAAQIEYGKKTLEFILSDYGSAISEGGTLEDLRNMRGTQGYMCPLVYDAYAQFEEDFLYVSSKFVEFTDHPGESAQALAARIWDSYADHESLKQRGVLDIDMAMTKNDIYALGVLILNFRVDSSSSSSHDLLAFARKLLFGDDPQLWSLVGVDTAFRELERSLIDQHAKVEFVRSRPPLTPPLPQPADVPPPPPFPFHYTPPPPPPPPPKSNSKRLQVLRGFTGEDNKNAAGPKKPSKKKR